MVIPANIRMGLSWQQPCADRRHANDIGLVRAANYGEQKIRSWAPH